MTGSKPRHTWVEVGATYGAVVAAKIVALVYRAVAKRGEQIRAGGREAETAPGWFLVWVDEPHRHYQLSSPPPRLGASAAELDSNALAALAEAGDVIEAKLVSGGSSGPNGR